MASKQAGAIFISLQLSTHELKASIANVQRQLNSLSNNARNLGKSLSLAFSLPLAGLGTYAVRSFAAFDDAMTRSIGIMGDAGRTMRSELVTGAEEIAKTTKFSATEAAEGYYFLAAAGLDAASSLKALPIVAKFAVAANVGLAESAGKLVDVTNAVGLASKDAAKMQEGLTRVSNVLAKASMDTNVSMNDLASSLAGPLGGILRQNSVQVETAAAALEVLGAQGIKGKAAGTALAIVIRELGIDAIKNADAFKKQGVAVFDSLGNFRNLVDVMRDMDKALMKLDPENRIKALKELGFTKKNTTFIQMLLGTSDALAEFEAANKTGNYTQKLFEENMKSFGNQLLVVKNSLQIVANQIGEDLSSSILSLGKAAVSAAEAFKNLPDGLRKAIEAFGVLLAIGGPVIFIFGNLASAARSLLVLCAPLAAGLFSIAAALGKFALGLVGLQLSALAIPALIVAAFVAAGAAIYIFWDDIQKAGENLLSWFSSTFPGLSVFLQAMWIAIRDGAVNAFEWIVSAAGSAWESIEIGWQGTVDWVSAKFDFLKKLGSAVWGYIAEKARDGLALIEGYFPGFTQMFVEVWDSIQKRAEDFFNLLTGWMNDALAFLLKIKGYIVDTSESIIAADNARKSAEAQAEAAKQAAELAKSQELLAKGQAAWNAVAPYGQKAVEALSGAYEDATKAIGPYAKAFNEAGTYKQRLIRQAIKDEEDAEKKRKDAEKAKTKADKENTQRLKTQAKALDNLRDKLSEATNKSSTDSIQEALDNAIKDGISDSAFAALSKQLRDSVYKGALDGLQDSIEKAGGGAEAVKLAEDIAEVKAEEEIEKYKDKKIKADQEIAEKKTEEDKKSYDESVEHFKDIFSKAIDGGAYDFREALKEAFVDIGANLAAIITQAISGKSVPGSADGGILGGIVSSIASIFQGPNSDGTTGIGPLASGDDYASMLGQQQAIADGINSAVLVGSAVLNSKDIDKKNKNNEGTGGAIGAGIGAIWGPVGAQIGQMLGAAVGSMFKWGSQNPETQARHAFANYIEETFSKLGQVSFFDAKGKLQNMKGKDYNFLEGGDFNSTGSENSVSKLNALGETARGTFLGLGMALKETLGLTDAVAEHLGAMLAENLGGNIDNARLLFQQLGLSLDDMVEKLVALGRSGDQSWLEIETAIQGVTEASKPGLVAVGDIKGAFDELVSSGGRGVAALKGVRDIAVEAMEAGATTIAELQQRLLAAGTNPEQVDALMHALEQRGIKTLQELADVSDRVGGGIVADMNAASTSLASLWADMTAQLQNIRTQIESIPTAVATEYKINVTTNMNDETRALLQGGNISLPQTTDPVQSHAKGGITTGTIRFGNHEIGEEGPEGLLPLAKMPNGSLGVRMIQGKGRKAMGGNSITINAPYATAGTADQIRKAVIQMEPYLTSRAVERTMRVAKRGGKMGGSFR